MSDGNKEELIKRIPGVVSLLDDCTARFAKETADGRALQEPVRLMLERGLSFTLRTAEAIGEQLQKERAPQAQILARSQLEVGTKLLWASRENGGWQRVQSDAAHRDLEWAEKAQGIQGLESVARSVLSTDEKKARAREAKQLPDMRTMLESIERLDEEAGLHSYSQLGLYIYFTIYALFSNPTHGHMAAVSGELDEHKVKHVTAACCYSATSMIRAVCHTFDWDIEDALKKVIPILRPPVEPSETRTT